MLQRPNKARLTGMGETLSWISRKIDGGAKFFMTEEAGAFSSRAGPLSKAVYDSFQVAYRGDGILIFLLRSS